MSLNSYNFRSYSHFRYTRKLNLEKLGVHTSRPWCSLALNRVLLTLELEYLLLHPVFTKCTSGAFAAWQILSDCVLIV